MKTLPASIKRILVSIVLLHPRQRSGKSQDSRMAHRVPVSMSRSNTARTAIVFPDASLLHGAWINHNGDQKTFAIPQNLQYSGFASEAYAAQQAIRERL